MRAVFQLFQTSRKNKSTAAVERMNYLLSCSVSESVGKSKQMHKAGVK